MKSIAVYKFFGILALIGLLSCGKEPIDESGLLITGRNQCFMTFFDLLGSDHRTVLVSGQTVIDTTALTVTAVARFGTNIQRVKPYCSVVTDAIVEPTMGIWTDYTQPQKYTVVSGNRQVRKTYTVTVTLQK
ncbi:MULTISPECIES: hypothetical protein [unclassified Spirosoma]|uniref:hypothetical protein n=1 Tax=unclassified Spirosoma TaxID=2621999 RepID=UPI000961E55D|nr:MULTISPECIES: hypothetical protein [unclassified Spirosoma]MBN8821967.1 hypothetical protein [Spirosoma sp.]OJW80379.1 MAG: hypothetical protein BGO59_33355 [Spirosoma sp. 48-14]